MCQCAYACVFQWRIGTGRAGGRGAPIIKLGGHFMFTRHIFDTTCLYGTAKCGTVYDY